MTRILQRMATPRPSTANEEARTIEMVVATEHDCGDGVILSCRQLPEFGPAPVPVLLSHQNNIAAMGGRLRSLRLEGRQVIGLAEFTDAPAAEAGWQLARSGCAVSVGARLDPEALQRQRSGPDLATKWRLNEASLVPVGADPNALTRSLAPEAMTLDNSNSNSNDDSALPVERSAKEVRRENAILRIAQAGGITDQQQIDRWVDSDLPLERVSYEAVRAMRIRLENGDVRDPNGPEPLGHPARHFATPANQRDLAGVLAAKMGVKGGDVRREWAGMPMHSLLREVVATSDPSSRGLDLASMPINRLVNRAFSTSDFTKALESSAERMLLSAYEEAQNGVLALATSRDLPDFRAMELIRVSQYGEISEKGQGGEYKTSSFAEELAATLQAAEYGALQSLTRKAVANDSLDVWGRLVSEMGRAAARKERSELVARLLGITFSSNNSTTASGLTAAGVIAGLTAATLKLRRQKDVDNNPVAFEPTTLLVPPELEAPARQALADYNPTEAGDVNPYRTLSLEVDHYLSASGVMYIHDSRYPSLVIGRIGGGPVITDDEDFSTGNRLFRVQSDFGTAVMDTRSICKVTLS
jgi:hypothetical protein